MQYVERRMDAARKAASDVRSPGETDYARVIHSFAFRRLQGKTQIYVSGECDYYRTRLTHSLETAQIAGGITRKLERAAELAGLREEARAPLPEQSLIHALGCAHDLGHPPFGHGGETALNYCMRDYGGFEGNGQTLRILATIEPYIPGFGLNLCRRTLLGVLKYPVSYTQAKAEKPGVPCVRTGPGGSALMDGRASKPPKCYLSSEEEIISWLWRPLCGLDREEVGRSRRKTLDCSIMEYADDIAYGVHDLEDAVALGLIEESLFRQCMTGKDEDFTAWLQAQGTGTDYIRLLFGDGEGRKHVIGRMVHYLICQISLAQDDAFEEPLYRFQSRMSEAGSIFIEGLKAVMMDGVIQTPRVQHLVFKGQQMVISVFDALASDPGRLTPKDCRAKWEAAADTSGQMRIICDYVSGMTDNYLLKTYERLFSPRMGSIFDPY